MYEIRCMIPCKIIILETKLCPNGFFDFDCCTAPSPPPPRYRFLRVAGGGGWGVKTWLAYSPHCASIQTQVRKKFFFPLWTPPQPMIGFPGAISRFPRSCPLWGPTVEDLAISGWEGLAEKSRFLGDLQQPPRTLGLLLGDHLVTMGVCINPWGAM